VLSVRRAATLLGARVTRAGNSASLAGVSRRVGVPRQFFYADLEAAPTRTSNRLAFAALASPGMATGSCVPVSRWVTG